MILDFFLVKYNFALFKTCFIYWQMFLKLSIELIKNPITCNKAIDNLPPSQGDFIPLVKKSINIRFIFIARCYWKQNNYGLQVSVHINMKNTLFVAIKVIHSCLLTKKVLKKSAS